MTRSVHSELVAECKWYLTRNNLSLKEGTTIQINSACIVVDLLANNSVSGDIPVECGDITSLKPRINLLLSKYPFMYWYPARDTLLKIEAVPIGDYKYPKIPGMGKLICAKCGHRWFSRIDKPKECPECKSRKWNKDTINVI